MFGDRVAALSGVGPRRVEAFEARGIVTILDLLHCSPIAYETAPPLLTATFDPERGACSVLGIVRRRNKGRLRGRRGGFLELSLDREDGAGTVSVRFYGQSWLFERAEPGVRFLVSGRRDPGPPPRIIATSHRVLEPGADPSCALLELRPRLPKIPGIADGILRRIFEGALERMGTLADPLPAAVREMAGVLPLTTAFRAVHHPRDLDDARKGGARFLFDRFLGMLLPVLRGGVAARAASPIPCGAIVRERILARLPFTLTSDQEAALDQILADLGREVPMRRLLQGDVGAGKTLVALGAALAVVAAKEQVLFLAPTEPLAGQHAAVFSKLLAGSRVQTGVLTAEVPPGTRRDLVASLARGKPDILVGTQALLASDVVFRKLSLVVIDEQQRFGVRERLRARDKGVEPHLLAMSATPIPRSLSLALLGDLDHTEIRTRPEGRRIPKANVTSARVACESVREAIDRGEQAFVVFPAIESAEMPSLLIEGRKLVQPGGLLAGIPHAFVHGRLAVDEREAALGAFRAGRLRLLLATSLVEVGIDVPQATVMVIAGAERFGLSNLHQLRGRVGRGALPGRCFLVPSRGAKNGAKARLSVLEGEEDGFKIAEADLLLRGPGEVFGLRQAGLGGELPIGPGEDASLFERASEAARSSAMQAVSLDRDSYYGLLAARAGTISGRPADSG